jgi:hypothetical protein
VLAVTKRNAVTDSGLRHHWGLKVRGQRTKVRYTLRVVCYDVFELVFLAGARSWQEHKVIE